MNSLRIAIVSSVLLAGCPVAVPSNDAAMEAGDVTAADPDAGTCASLPVVDLNVVGRTTMEDGVRVTRLVSNNLDTVEGIDVGLQVPAGFEEVCDFGLSHQKLYKYRVGRTSVLRVSTRNPGTSAAFDSVIAISSSACDGFSLLGCGDDDPRFTFADPADTGMLTTVLTRNSVTGERIFLNAGTEVIIAVGGYRPLRGAPENHETGTFELSVSELVPLAMGAVCNPSGTETACMSGLSCVRRNPSDATGFCQPFGAVIGAPCNGPSCATGLTCDLSENICFETVALNQACDSTHHCDTGLSCVASPLGSLATSGSCKPLGSAGAACRADGSCDPTLTCLERRFQSSICVPARPANASCSVGASACPREQSCVPNLRGGLVGTCRDRGTVAGANCFFAGNCSTDLACPAGVSVDTCRATPASTERCERNVDICEIGQCASSRLSDRIYGTCVAPRSAGSTCASSADCAMGLTCSTQSGTRNTCVRIAQVGQPCSPFVTCPADTTCVYPRGAGQDGECRAAGSAGAPCRYTDQLCDAGLVCSGLAPNWVCQIPTPDSSCDPVSRTLACPAGTLCAVTGVDAGRCVTPTLEREPNDAPTLAQRITLPTNGTGAAVIRGSLTASEVDCYTVMVPQGASLQATLSWPSGLCPSARDQQTGFGLVLFAPDQSLLGSDTTGSVRGCARFDGNDAAYPWARNLAAGVYSVCLRNRAFSESPVDAYSLSIVLSAP